jgi:hypothetical protein
MNETWSSYHILRDVPTKTTSKPMPRLPASARQPVNAAAIRIPAAIAVIAPTTV